MEEIDFNGQEPNYDDLTVLEERFIGFKAEDIKTIIYFDGWADYEEDGGLLIFKNSKDELFILEYGYSVMAENHDEDWNPCPISQKHATSLINEMKQTISENQRPMF